VSRAIRTELFKLRKRGLTWILLYVLIGILVLVNLIIFAITRIQLPSSAPHDLADIAALLLLRSSIPFSLFILSTFGAVLAVILMGSAVGNEYNWRTIRLALISTESRFKFLLAKVIAVAFAILIGMLIGVAVGFLTSIITTAIGGDHYDFSFATGSYFWDQFLQFWRTFFIILPFTLLAFLFAVLGRSAMPGIAVGIGVAFLEPLITGLMRLAGGWVDNIPDYLFSANVNAINALNQLPSGFGSGQGFGGGSTFALPSVPHAFIVLAVYCLVFAVIPFYLFRKRDVTG
jgi:ABC-2 type transport system permease protein